MNTRLEVTSLRKYRPDLTLQQIGDRVNLSRERVRQILSSEGLQTINTEWHHKCKVCGIRISHDRIYCEDHHPIRKFTVIKCVCGCNKTFLKETAQLNRSIEKGYNHFFKNRLHYGVWKKAHPYLPCLIKEKK